MDKKQENGNNQGQNGAGEQNDPSTKDKDEDFFKTDYWDSFGAMDEWDVEGAWEIEWQHRNKKTAVFAVCPNKDLAINTAEFWKTKQAAEAFDLMYETVKPKLEKIQPITFEEDPFAAGEREVKLNKDLQNQVMLYKVRTWGSWDAENISETPL